MERIKLRIGATLLFLQRIEALLKACLLFTSSEIELDSKLQALLNNDRRTLGVLLKELKNNITLPSDFETALTNLLHNRNILVHSLILQDWYDLRTPDGQQKMNEFIESILADASIANSVFVSYVISLELSENAQVPEALKAKFDNIISRILITAEPNLKDKTLEECIANFREKLDLEYIPKIIQKT